MAEEGISINKLVELTKIGSRILYDIRAGKSSQQSRENINIITASLDVSEGYFDFHNLMYQIK